MRRGVYVHTGIKVTGFTCVEKVRDDVKVWLFLTVYVYVSWLHVSSNLIFAGKLNLSQYAHKNYGTLEIHL